MCGEEMEIEQVLQDHHLFLPTRTTIASFPGGKSAVRKHLPLYLSAPRNIGFLVEPFAGLANFFLVLAPRITTAWLNDKDKEIYDILTCLANPDLLEKLIDRVHSIQPVERDDYYDFKAKKPNRLVDQALRRLVILNCSPNGAGGGYSHEKAHRKWYINKPKIWYQIQKIFADKKIRITNLDYLEVLEELFTSDSNSVFCYLDPPYYQVAKKGRLYGKAYNVIDWIRLKEKIMQLKCHWILSNRNLYEMRELFSEFCVEEYNTYNDMNNTQSNNPELLVSNKPLWMRTKNWI